MTDTPADRPPSPPRRRRRRAWLIAGAALLLFLSLGDSCATYPSVAFERGSDGAFEVVSGTRPRALQLGAAYSRATVNHTTTTSSVTEPTRPMRASSFSIVDLSGTGLTRRVAHGVAAQLRKDERVIAVDIRVAGEPLDRPLLGDQLLFIEEVVEGGWPVGPSHAHVKAWLGHIPVLGWADFKEVMQPTQFRWNVEVELLLVGSPLQRLHELANQVVDALEVPELLDKLHGGEWPSVPPFPNPPATAVDLGDAAEVTAAMGVEAPPFLSGSRHCRQGEAHWRLEGPDVVDRIEAAMEVLPSHGWTAREGVGSRGNDGRQHMIAFDKGTQTVHLVFEENRTNALQTEWWSTDATGGQTHHVEGPALVPAVWIHYRNEADEDELRAQLAVAEGLGQPARDAFLANLTALQRETLGID